MLILLWIFKGLLGLKKLATLLLSLAKTPFSLLYRWILLPVFVHAYRGIRYLRKKLAHVFEHVQDRTLRILANRYTVNAFVVVLVFFVTATNIYASDPSRQIDALGQQSVVASAIQGDDGEDVTMEQVTNDAPATNQDVSYLDGQALSARQGTDSLVTDGGSDAGFNLIDDGTASGKYESPIANSVRVEPDLGNEAPPTRTKVETHVVQNGETLGSIAQDFGLSIETILAANGLSGSAIIRPGQSLRIPPTDGVLYTVKRGDTLNGIATKYKSDPDAILRENGLADATSLAIGSEIMLPGGRRPVPPPAPKPPQRINGSVRDLVTPSAAPDRIGTGKLLWPTEARRITQYYGNYFHGVRHTGMDIAGPIGTPIYAADDGVVIAAGWNTGGYGNMTVIDHGGGLFTRYGHASKLLTTPGQTVKRGDLIALMGSTGHSTGPHLHFEVMTGSVWHRVNPLEWIR